ncbi:hypothetical protein GCM10011609_85670 [Lentzea pudingi]|uniref:Uncharacterized protein n=1 Tax=Lentzea pudingi TaxID=1789439 RepID=A0ABQ2ISE7_9PSEU|nr:hypothetical protein [Lentzea pudingi]GGN28990.1 hypothetical protein GCM10011609_85670 [Lentzea pudingi]
MRRWLIAMVAAVVTSGVGISINVATDLGGNMLAWAAVGVLTIAAGAVAVWAAPAADGEDGTRNEISGTVTGPVVQARDISGPITFKDDGS